MKIKWNLFEPTGKWKYKGISNIPDDTELWDDNVIQLIDENQNSVLKGVIIKRHYHLVVSLIEDRWELRTKFFEAMFPSLYGMEVENK